MTVPPTAVRKMMTEKKIKRTKESTWWRWTWDTETRRGYPSTSQGPLGYDWRLFREFKTLCRQQLCAIVCSLLTYSLPAIVCCSKAALCSAQGQSAHMLICRLPVLTYEHVIHPKLKFGFALVTEGKTWSAHWSILATSWTRGAASLICCSCPVQPRGLSNWIDYCKDQLQENR